MRTGRLRSSEHRTQKPIRGCNKHERPQFSEPSAVHCDDPTEEHARPIAESRQALPGRSGGVRKGREDRRRGVHPRRGEDDQQVAVCPRKRHQRFDGPQSEAHPLSRLEAHQNPHRVPRRKRKDVPHGRVLPFPVQRGRDGFHAAIRDESQEHQEQREDQPGEVCGGVEAAAREGRGHHRPAEAVHRPSRKDHHGPWRENS
mmetsp:Transcript_15162/g.30731  ORF Transcript_15162/g.30731 Transcript_15162/m.30731 type:complete len:201 (+) Transcript_15162:665-1267(+)